MSSSKKGKVLEKEMITRHIPKIGEAKPRELKIKITDVGLIARCNKIRQVLMQDSNIVNYFIQGDINDKEKNKIKVELFDQGNEAYLTHINRTMKIIYEVLEGKRKYLDISSVFSYVEEVNNNDLMKLLQKKYEVNTTQTSGDKRKSRHYSIDINRNFINQSDFPTLSSYAKYEAKECQMMFKDRINTFPVLKQWIEFLKNNNIEQNATNIGDIKKSASTPKKPSVAQFLLIHIFRQMAKEVPDFSSHPNGITKKDFAKQEFIKAGKIEFKTGSNGFQNYFVEYQKLQTINKRQNYATKSFDTLTKDYEEIYKNFRDKLGESALKLLKKEHSDRIVNGEKYKITNQK